MIASCIRRLLHIIHVLTRHAFCHAVARAVDQRNPLSVWAWLKPLVELGRLPSPTRLRIILEELGGSFIKLGQMLALQPDVVPVEYCNALFNLMDRIGPFPFEQVESIFVEELGIAPSNIFDSIDSHPIATGSIGQVHIATLAGAKLAVKVQRPNAKQDFAGDVQLMSGAIRLVKAFHLKKLYWTIDPITEFVSWTREELDYRCEARYVDQLRANAKNNAREQIPAVLHEYSTSRILVTDFLEGVSVLEYLRAAEDGKEDTFSKLRAWDFDSHRFARHIIDNFLGDAFRHGMFHADLHPANLMILPRSVVGYIDFGITGVLTTYSRRHLIALTLAYSRGDLDGMCASFFKISTIASNSSTKRFRDGLDKLASEWYHAPGEGPRLRKSITTMMMELLELSRESAVLPERDVIKYIRSAIALDGLIKRIAPTFDVGLHLETICRWQIKWEMRRSLWSYNTFLVWSTATARLIETGLCRMAEVLQSGVDAHLSPRDSGGTVADRDRALRLRVTRLGLLVLAAALLVFTFGDKGRLGVNVFSADLALLAISAVELFRNLRRLA